jgi:hypothetical protein
MKKTMIIMLFIFILGGSPNVLAANDFPTGTPIEEPNDEKYEEEEQETEKAVLFSSEFQTMMFENERVQVSNQEYFQLQRLLANGTRATLELNEECYIEKGGAELECWDVQYDEFVRLIPQMGEELMNSMDKISEDMADQDTSFQDIAEALMESGIMEAMEEWFTEEVDNG